MIQLYMNGRNVPSPHCLEGAVVLEETYLHGPLHDKNNNYQKC